MKLKVWILGILLAIGACTADKKDDNKELPPEELERVRLYDAAREVHDEMMPYIDSIFNSRGIIMEEIERATEGLKEINEERKKALKEIAKELEDADEAMFAWMRKHSAMPDDSLSSDEIIQRLEESFEEINSTREQMLESLKKASKLISTDSSTSN